MSTHTPQVESDGLRRYGTWAGNPGGRKEDVTRCAVQVSSGDSRVMIFRQCPNKRGHGEGGIYCRRHASPVGVATRLYVVGTSTFRQRSDGIKPIDAFDVTPDTYRSADGRRFARRTKYELTFDSWADARAFLVESAHRHVEIAERSLSDARENLDSAQALPEQEPKTDA